ncbi:MAG: Flp pilus assembly secretin CpaC [Hyphomicrobiaceae bacterium]|jgi:Flp pilus assembly secretin CpaC
MSGLLARPSFSSSRTLLALITGTAIVAATSFSAITAKAADLIVKYDQSQLLRVARPVAEIIIGNPTIADISVQSKKLLVVTGKSFGKTNMILLDSEQNVIQENLIVVLQDQAQVVNLRRGVARESYNCAPRCNPTITASDDEVYFKKTAGKAQMKIKLSEGGGGGAGGGGGGGQ